MPRAINGIIRRLLRGASCAALLLTMLSAGARADVPVYTQPPNSAGGQYKSSWYAPDGMDNDEYVWDGFTLASSTAITSVKWRGAYTNYLSGAGKSPVYDFTVAIYPSTPGLSQPDITHPPLVRYHTNGNAGETAAGMAGGVAMYDYAFTLPAAFEAVGGTEYWIQIEAYQGLTPTYYWPPDWSIARGTGGNNSHFRKVGGTGGSFAYITGDAAFTLLASSLPTYTVSASALPAGAGTISGTGQYPPGVTASLTATANPGFGFVQWTEGATMVSTNAHYTFTVSGPRTLVANFVPAYTITTGSWPSYGGTTSGGGVFNQGATVTLTATPAPGFVFDQWTWFGTPVSTSSTYTFAAGEDLDLTAQFVHAPGGATFDFDDAPVHTSLPIALIADGLGAAFSGTGSGYSTQPVGTVGIAPAGFAGLCLYPNSVFAADLIVDFSEPVILLSMMYSTQELACDTSARMRVTAYLGGTVVGTNTATAPVPGTWPTGTIGISVPGGFTRAVIHYDAPPPGCQDYGVIFMADNLTVVRPCVAPTLIDQPAPISACVGGSATFVATAAGTEPLAYSWRKDGVPMDAGANPSASTWALVISPVTTADAGSYDCVVQGACGAVTTAAATLSLVTPCGLADISEIGGTALAPGCPDHQLTVDDIIVFVNLFSDGTGCPGAGPCSAADVCGIGGSPEPPDGQLTVDDIIAFFNAFSDGCV